MDTRTADERLELSDCAPLPLWHIMYENFYRGSIGQRQGGWHAYINCYDFGDFATLHEAQQAVIGWFGGLDIEPGD